MSLNPVISNAWDILSELACQIEIPTKEGKMVPLTTRGEMREIKALSGYAEREGFFGTLATIAHRVWNAVKAIFGQSDWQKGERAYIALSQRINPIIVNGKELTKKDIEEIKRDLPKVLPLIDAANAFVKPQEALLLPFTAALKNNINVERIAQDKSINTIKENILDKIKKMPEPKNRLEKMSRVITALAQCGYVKPEGEAQIKKTLPLFEQFLNKK